MTSVLLYFVKKYLKITTKSLFGWTKMIYKFNPFTKNFDIAGDDVTSGLSDGYIPVVQSGDLADSIIYQDSGRIGIDILPIIEAYKVYISGIVGATVGGYFPLVSTNQINPLVLTQPVSINPSTVSAPDRFRVAIGVYATGVDGSPHIQTSGENGGLYIKSIYNQPSGTAANTDLKINRVETAVGSGEQLLIDLQKEGISKLKVYTDGSTSLINGAGALDIKCESDGAIRVDSSSGATLFLVKKTLADDESYIISDIESGSLHVIAETTTIDVYGLANVFADGVSVIAGSVATADIDGQLCLYKSGADLVIKNRRGSTRNLTIKVC